MPDDDLDDDFEDGYFGPWREPRDDDESEDFEDLGDGECVVALSSRTATGASISAAVERWLRMPHHYSLREYLEDHRARVASDKAAATENRGNNDD